MGFFTTIVIGLFSGLLASWIMRVDTDLLVNLILGVIGSLLAGWASSIITGQNLITGLNLTSILVSLAGSIVVLMFYRFIFGKK